MSYAAAASGSAAFEARIAELTRLRKLDADTIAELTQQQQRDMAAISRLDARLGSKPGTAVDGHPHNPPGDDTDCDAAWTKATERCLAYVASMEESGIDDALSRILALGKQAKAFADALADARKKFEPGHGHSSALPAALEAFPLLKEAASVVQVTGKPGDKVRPLRDAVAAIRKDPESEAAMQTLEALAAKLKTAYETAIGTRLAAKDLFKQATEVIDAGNGAFVDVYGAVGHLIEVSEPAGVAEYKAAAERGAAAVAANRAELGYADGAPLRNPPTLPTLYQASARAKPVFDKGIKQAVAEHNAAHADDPGMQVELKLPDALKDAVRAIEKAMLAADPDEVGNCGMVLDVVRAMVVCDSMASIAAMFDRLRQHTGLKIVRIKERFYHAPSAGGWRDMMANFALLHPETGAVMLIVEVQLCHTKLLTARADLPGHLVYNPVRVAMELLERKFKSAAVVVDAVALCQLHRRCLPDGGIPVYHQNGESSRYSEYGLGSRHVSSRDFLLEDKGWLSGTALGDWDKVDVNAGGRVSRLDLKKLGLQGTLPRSLAALVELEYLDLRDNPDLLPIIGAPLDSAGLMCYHNKEQVQAFLRHLALDDRGRELALQRGRLVEKHGPEGPALRAIFDEGNGREWKTDGKGQWFAKKYPDPASWHG